MIRAVETGEQFAFLRVVQKCCAGKVTLAVSVTTSRILLGEQVKGIQKFDPFFAYWSLCALDTFKHCRLQPVFCFMGQCQLLIITDYTHLMIFGKSYTILKLIIQLFFKVFPLSFPYFWYLNFQRKKLHILTHDIKRQTFRILVKCPPVPFIMQTGDGKFYLLQVMFLRSLYQKIKEAAVFCIRSLTFLNQLEEILFL